MLDIRILCSNHCLSTATLCFLHPLLVSLPLQIAYRVVRNLLIGIHKLVEKGSINLLYHITSATFVISIIINVPAVASFFNPFMAKFFDALHNVTEEPFYQITHTIYLPETIRI